MRRTGPRTGPRDRAGARRALAGTLLALTLTLGWAAAAHASAFGQTFSDYRKHGKVDPCKFSAHTLKQAKSQVPPDIEQYAPDFPAALDAALQARARGGCGGSSGSAGSSGSGASSAAGGVAGAAGTSNGGPPPSSLGGSSPSTSPSGSGSGTPGPGPVITSPPDVRIRNASHATRGSSGFPVPLIVIAAVAALLALLALAWSLVRWRGWEPGWWPGFRHTLAEASWRTGNGWSEFSDWLRFGH